MNFSRENPSPRYLELTRLYRRLHVEGEQRMGLPPEATYPGMSLFTHIKHVKDLIGQTGARTILDYGCGKGHQYRAKKIVIKDVGTWRGVSDYWGVDQISCYDPCVESFCQLPQGQFDGVISTDVLEHCPEQDLPWIVAEMFSYATKFVFANVACYPARTTLPNGENAHCTVQPLDWWSALFGEVAKTRPQVRWTIMVEDLGDGSSAPGAD
jgi:hypothetical protein